jgi:type I restriction enzyme S subunit
MFDDFPFETVTELQARGVLRVEDGNHGNDRPRPDEFGSGNTAFIRAADMDGGRVLFESAEKINEVALARIRKGKGKPGDILFSSKGTVGKLARVEMNAPPFVCSPQTTYWRTLDENRLDRTFLYAFMQSSAFIEQWEAIKGDTDMADYASLTSQRQFRVPLPDIKFQRNAASVFRPLDDMIALNRRMSRTLETLAAAAFRSWFVDFDPVVAKAAGRKPAYLHPGLSALFPATFQDSPIGPIPHGWEIKTIKAIADYVNGRAFTKGATGTGRMVIRIAELNSGPGGSTVYNDVAAAPENVAQPGDLLFAWSGSLDVYRWFRDEAIINQHIFKVICEKYPQWFVHQQLREAMPFFQDIAADKATTMGHIKREHLSQAFLALPPKELLDAADKIFQPLYTKQLANERESLTLAALRNTLLPKLLSGELRVKSTEKELASHV